MPLNLVEAGAITGRSKSSILRAIKRGALSATRDDTTGGWCIEEAELLRAFPHATGETDHGTSRNRSGNPTIRELQARLDAADARYADAHDQITDLRRRLDTADEERRRLTAILADQRERPKLDAPIRRWWQFRRG